MGRSQIDPGCRTGRCRKLARGLAGWLVLQEGGMCSPIARVWSAQGANVSTRDGPCSAQMVPNVSLPYLPFFDYDCAKAICVQSKAYRDFEFRSCPGEAHVVRLSLVMQGSCRSQPAVGWWSPLLLLCGCCVAELGCWGGAAFSACSTDDIFHMP